MKSTLSTEQVSDFKQKIKSAFADLRKLGYFARQNFQDCQTCAWAAVPEFKGDKVVFYHQQDADGIPSGKIHIAWSGNGRLIVEIFKEHGLSTSWDGDASKRIVIEYVCHQSE
jgi:hypothetical protein